MIVTAGPLICWTCVHWRAEPKADEIEVEFEMVVSKDLKVMIEFSGT